MATAPASERPRRGSEVRDGYLCFCEEITADAFRAEMAADPGRSFEELCAETRLASKCTACLLNAETIFSEGDGTPAQGPRQRIRRRQEGGWNRQRLYGLIDAIAPRVARTVPGIIPVIAGPEISTKLTFANVIPPVIGDQAPPFDVRAEISDGEGLVVARHEGRVERNGRVEFDISRALSVTNGRDDLVTGSCRLTYRAAEKGYIGCIRPHFSVRTLSSIASVHSAGAGRENAVIETCMLNPEEKQFVSAVNCTTDPVRVSMSLHADGATTPIGVTDLPPHGARLIDVPRDKVPGGRPFAVLTESDGEVRWHYLVATGQPPRISLDHI